MAKQAMSRGRSGETHQISYTRICLYRLQRTNMMLIFVFVDAD